MELWLLTPRAGLEVLQAGGKMGSKAMPLAQSEPFPRGRWEAEGAD